MKKQTTKPIFQLLIGHVGKSYWHWLRKEDRKHVTRLSHRCHTHFTRRPLEKLTNSWYTES